MYYACCSNASNHKNVMKGTKKHMMIFKWLLLDHFINVFCFSKYLANIQYQVIVKNYK